MVVFSSNFKGSINLINCPDKVDKLAMDVFTPLSKVWVSKKPKIHILNFKEVKDMDPNSYRDMMLFFSNCKKEGQQVSSIHVPMKLRSQLKNDGVIDAFNISANLESACKSAGFAIKAEVPKIDVRVVNPYVKSFAESFQLEFDRALNAEKPSVSKEVSNFGFGYLCFLDLNSESFNGQILTFFPEGFLDKVVKEEPDPEDLDFFYENLCEDLMSDVLSRMQENLVEEHKIQVFSSFPKVIHIKEETEVHHNPVRIALNIKMTCDVGEVMVEVHIQ